MIEKGLCIEESWYVLTDDREVFPDAQRPYRVRDGRDPRELERFVNLMLKLNREQPDHRCVLVIDGGGNRTEIDDWLSSVSTLCVLPADPSFESVKRVWRDAERMPSAVILPNRWPTNSFAAQADKPLLEVLHQEFPGRVLEPLPSMHAVNKLLAADFTALDSGQRTFCRAVADRVYHTARARSAGSSGDQSLVER
ncbi:hypothetical protein OPU71_10240 [Niveibacterium sp. 24ML]|uniref:hypothetical protein n=1 Tax=Niveibacterium sp. 24ML TaxID=2985512 RepID=UPI002271AF4C|nr:hypothetical protein [Niveibacterium sp. 24ML]MCX9156500.1 hypothetical protein [Niveibacterium sp. 24ML]